MGEQQMRKSSIWRRKKIKGITHRAESYFILGVQMAATHSCKCCFCQFISRHPAWLVCSIVLHSFWQVCITILLKCWVRQNCRWANKSEQQVSDAAKKKNVLWFSLVDRTPIQKAGNSRSRPFWPRVGLNLHLLMLSAGLWKPSDMLGIY